VWRRLLHAAELHVASELHFAAEIAPGRSIPKHACSCPLRTAVVPHPSSAPSPAPRGNRAAAGRPYTGVRLDIQAPVVLKENSIDSYRGAIDSESLKYYN
jgi:hypothetical protein